MLDRVVLQEAAEHTAGDEVASIYPLALGKKVIDILRLDVRTPEPECGKNLWRLSVDNLEAKKVRLLLDDYCAGGLAVVGFSDTARAFEQGQVNDLLLSASVREIHDHLLSAAIQRGNTPRTVAR